MSTTKKVSHYIFRPYITKNGKRIYRKGGGMFRIPIYEK